MMTTFFVDAESNRDVLARVVMLFHRRGIPIQSLVVASSRSGSLRMNITAGVEEERSLRIVADLYKLVGVQLVDVNTLP
jgi:acetolactate synthase small subunit